MLDFPDFGELELKKALATIEGTEQKFSRVVNGNVYNYGSGGLHFGDKGIWEGNIIDVDFSSLYPAIMANFNLGSRKIKNPEKIRELMEQRLAFKKAKDPRANALKIVINSIFGVSGDPNSEIYDPEACFSVCACGQVITTYLSHAVAPFCQIIQGNTDGLFCLVNDEKGFIEAANKVSEDVGIGVEFDHYVKMIQRDVNNYVALASDGSYHSKGKIFKERNELDNDCPIIQKALINYIRFGGYRSFIENDTDLIDYGMIIRKGRAYKALYHGYVSPETKLGDTNRVFACVHRTGGVIKQKFDDTVVKYPALPENIKVDNGDVRDKQCPFWLDKDWYIHEVEKILDEWGLLPKPKTTATLDMFMEGL